MADLPILISDPGTNFGPLTLTGPGTDDTMTISMADVLPDSAHGQRRQNRQLELSSTAAFTVAGAAGDIAAGRGTPVAANEKYPVLWNANGQKIYIQGTAAQTVVARMKT